MRPVAFYRVTTDSINPQFGIGTEQKGDIGMPYFTHAEHTIPDPRDPGLPHLQMLLARTPASDRMPRELYVARFGYNSHRKPIELKKIPDLWTGNIPLASERFLHVIGADGRDAVEVMPINLYDFASGERFAKKYYTLIFRHVAKIERLPGADRKAVCDWRSLTPEQLVGINRVVSTPLICDHIQAIPFWTTWKSPFAAFVSISTGEILFKSQMSGFRELKSMSSNGDVSHVWATAPSPDAQASIVNGSAGLTTALRYASSAAS